MTMASILAADLGFLMADFGADWTLTRPVVSASDPVVSAYDPATGTTTPGTPQTFTVRGVFINYMDSNVDGTVIQMGDRRFLMRAEGAPTQPEIGDQIDGLQVVDVRTVAPNGTSIAFSCQMRR